jgi:hypothetical protein
MRIGKFGSPRSHLRFSLIEPKLDGLQEARSSRREGSAARHKHIRKAAPRMSVRVVPSPQALEMLRERIESTDDINAIDAAAASPL